MSRQTVIDRLYVMASKQRVDEDAFEFLYSVEKDLNAISTMSRAKFNALKKDREAKEPCAM